jgi:ABC-type lipoprotein export system ATPase subunit
VEGWSATVEGGESVAIVGPSGSGKSTLLYLLGLLARPWSGRLEIAGHDVQELDDRARSDIRAEHIGFVFQDAVLDTKRSVLANVIEGAIYRGSDRSETIRSARELVDELGVCVELDRRAVDLSGGQAQRVALARALVGRPSILLADEPTGNLDKENGRVVADALFDQTRQGKAVVIVTHDLELAQRCDRTLQL